MYFMQYNKDQARLVDLIHKFTGIKKRSLTKYLKDNSVESFLKNPTVIEITETQLQKLAEIRELWGLFENLKNEEQYTMNSSQKAMDYFKKHIGKFRGKERVAVAFLDRNLNIISTKTTIGTLSEAVIYPREIIKEAILKNASSVIMAHNHPGGTVKASSQDLTITKIIAKACYSIGITLNDHIIVTDQSAVSLKEERSDLFS